jgi:alpha-ribazole phosphatase
MLDLYFIRHTSVAVSKAVCYGSSDVSLSENFMYEKQEVWQKFSRAASNLQKQAVHIYSSPLQRCQLLATFVAQQIEPQLPITLDKRIQEMHFGDWEMKKWDELPIDSFQTWMTAFMHTTVPNGENLTKLHQRSSSFLTTVIEKHYKNNSLQPESVLIFSHAGTIRTMLAQCLGMPLENTFRFGMEYGALSRARYMEGYWKIDFINR